MSNLVNVRYVRFLCYNFYNLFMDFQRRADLFYLRKPLKVKWAAHKADDLEAVGSNLAQKIYVLLGSKFVRILGVT